MIRAIETRYNGYRFRSRLEARWAVFFDALGIEYQYEPEGFDLNGEWYLPDFWLPTFDGHGMYVEVKHTGGDFSKSRLFTSLTRHRIWLAEGPPDFRAYQYLEFDPWGDSEPFAFVGIPNADQAQFENRMFAQPGYENDDLSIPDFYIDCLGDTFINAVYAARQARFEHGERIHGRLATVYASN